MLIIALQESENDFACNIRVYFAPDCELSYTSPEKSWRVSHKGALGRHVTIGSGIIHNALYINAMVHDLEKLTVT
jgi:hypothetical protein